MEYLHARTKCWLCCSYLNSQPNKDMQVVMGGLSLDTDEPADQTVRVVEAMVHEGYRETPSAVYNDIGEPFLFWDSLI